MVRIGEVRDQLDRASSSIPLNIAEDREVHAQGPLPVFRYRPWLRTGVAAGLDILVARSKLTADEIRPGKERLRRIVRMLMGLIKRNSNRDYDRGNAEN